MSHALVSGNIIGKSLERIRKENGLSQVELAAAMCVEKKINMQRTTISQIECGTRAVKDKEILALCEILDITPNELFDYE